MNVYENGVGDARQSDAPNLAPQHSLFRKRYRQLSADEVALHDAIKDKADELANLFYKITDPFSAENFAGTEEQVSKAHNVGLAVGHLEDAVYRAVKALTT